MALAAPEASSRRIRRWSSISSWSKSASGATKSQNKKPRSQRPGLSLFWYYLAAAALLAALAIRLFRRAAWFLWMMPRWAALSIIFCAVTSADWVWFASPVAAAVRTFLTSVLRAVRVALLRTFRFAVLRRSFLLDLLFAM